MDNNKDPIIKDTATSASKLNKSLNLDGDAQCSAPSIHLSIDKCGLSKRKFAFLTKKELFLLMTICNNTPTTTNQFDNLLSEYFTFTMCVIDPFYKSTLDIAIAKSYPSQYWYIYL